MFEYTRVVLGGKHLDYILLFIIHKMLHIFKAGVWPQLFFVCFFFAHYYKYTLKLNGHFASGQAEAKQLMTQFNS